MSYEVISVGLPDTPLIEKFLSNAGNSLLKFRYFSSRPVAVIKNHVVTLLVLKGKEPVGYGHLDKDNEKIWLGTCVAEKEKGKGIGKMIMERLLAAARENGISRILLAVDNDNAAAQSLYKKYGFELIKKESQISYMEAKTG